MAISDAYSMGVRFETTSDQGAEALDAAKTSADTDFNYRYKNCTSVCRDALDAVDINHGDFRTPSNLINCLWSNPESQPVIIENNNDEK